MKIQTLKDKILALEKNRVVLRESGTFRIFGIINMISLVAVVISYVLIWVQL